MKQFKINIFHKIIAGVLLVTILMTSVYWGSLLALAYEEKTGMICRDDGELTITRVEPSDESDKVSGLEYGKPVTVVEEVVVDGVLWYKIKYTLKKDGSERNGYCRAEYVLLDENATVFAKGTIIADNVYVRNDAGTDGTYMLVALNKGHSVEFLTQTTINNETWYRVRCVYEENTYIGWVLGSYVSINEYVVEEDLEFEEHLRKIGFPESYINSLMLLHTKYPNWKFVPVKTGLDWDVVMENESVPNRNLVPVYFDDARKSVSASDYDWYTNKWVPRDSGQWVTAHPDFIAYCMDPRNFINEKYIFMFESLSFSEVHNLSGINAIISGTFMTTDVVDTDGSTLNYANAFMKIGKEINVSPYHLASRIRQEQGVKGDSVLISGTYPGYEGYFNYFNIKASGSDYEQIVKNGLQEAKDEGWTTRYLALLGGSKKIAKNYISLGQDTLYFQKFNVVYKEGLYWHQYMQNLTAAQTESQKVEQAYTDKTQAFVFRIPIYENMPEEAVTFTATGNRNNYLSSLTVSSGLTFTPNFDGAKTSYSLIVDYGVSTITVDAKAVAGTSSVTGTGTYDLNVGSNTITVKCKSQSGDTKVYTITVVRQEKTETPDEETYEFSSEIYKIGDVITKVKSETTVSDFIAGFTCNNCTLKVLNADNTENTGKVGTGNKLAVYFKDELKSVQEIIVYGDVNGDSEISILDMIKIKRHILGLGTLNGSYLVAADVNESDGGISILDMITIKRHILGLIEIEK